MIGLTRAVRVFAYGAPVDLRKGYNGLSALVEQEMKHAEDRAGVPEAGHFLSKCKRRGRVGWRGGKGGPLALGTSTTLRPPYFARTRCRARNGQTSNGDLAGQGAADGHGCSLAGTDQDASARRADLSARCNPHVYALLLDGVYAPDVDGKGQMFHLAPGPSQHDIDQVVKRTSKRILRFLQRRGVITLVTAPGDGEVTIVGDETMGDKDPLLARLLAAATAGAPVPSGPRTRTPCHLPTRASRAPVACWVGQQAQTRAHRA